MLLSILFILFGADELRSMLKSFKLKKSSMNMKKKGIKCFSFTPKENKIEDAGGQRQIDYSKGTAENPQDFIKLDDSDFGKY